MKIRLKTKILVDGKIYNAGEVLSSPPLPKNKILKVLELLKNRKEMYEIIKEKEDVSK
ncbi:MAG: hypothetical protein NC901_03185 [Candidatus Omnitrophica bacterium]|nr:hypothetical protein [Candidatus Omnitrophota bacterium]